ncbi:MAG: PASTA domain-containing protein [Muribaculaceae bacterium]|nr:PASTA domain-containing protein [Muribaculaceae bacterium]
MTSQKQSSRRNKAAGQGTSRRSHILGRLGLITLLILLMAGAIVFMLFNTTVINAGDWNAKAESTLNDTITIKPKRGDILASDGSILATNLNYYNIRIDYRADRFMIEAYSKAIDSLADSMSRYFPVRNREQWKKKLEYPLTLTRSKRSRSYLLLRQIPFDQVERIRKFPFFKLSRNSNRTGLTAEPVLVRRYPYGEMAKLSIGRVGEVKGGEKHGISGLERALDSLLYGKPGKATKVMFTNRVAPWTLEPQQDGYTVRTTIDITMQDIVEHELEEILRETDAEWGTAILMEVATGDIKAISNLERDTVPGTGRYIEAMNRAVQAYEPGSVLKAVSMTVALEDGLATLDQSYVTEHGGYQVSNFRVRDTHFSPTSTLPLMEVLAYSSNISMAKIIVPHYRNDINSYRERVRRFGLMERWGTGIAGERPAWFPTLDPRSGGLVTLTQQAFGYGCMVPPLYTCAFYNAIANDGKFVKPRLMQALRLANGSDSLLQVSYVRDSICSKENARILREMLYGVVDLKPGGTAWRLKSKDDPFNFAGKTGTAKIARERDPRHPEIPVAPGYIQGAYRFAFCGFFPYEEPRYTMMVLVSYPKPGYGAWSTSGRVFKNTALKMYSRGMFGKPSDYRDNAPAEPSPAKLYAFSEAATGASVIGNYAPKASVSRTPGKTVRGTVPDVKDLGLRQALVKLEKAGYNVAFSGQGAVVSQIPKPAQKPPPAPK